MPYLTTRKNLKLQLSPGLVASYDIQPGNGVGLFWDTTHTPDPHGGGTLQYTAVLSKVDDFATFRKVEVHAKKSYFLESK